MKKIYFSFLLVFLFMSCGDGFKKVPEQQFVGLWQVSGSSMINDIQIKIDFVDGKLIGKVHKLNDNKYVQLFSDSADVWFSEINRKSNVEFTISQKKIGSDLFALYGQTTTQQYNVKFISADTIGFALENSDPLKSTYRYIRIKDK